MFVSGRKFQQKYVFVSVREIEVEIAGAGEEIE